MALYLCPVTLSSHSMSRSVKQPVLSSGAGTYVPLVCVAEFSRIRSSGAATRRRARRQRRRSALEARAAHAGPQP